MRAKSIRGNMVVDLLRPTAHAYVLIFLTGQAVIAAASYLIRLRTKEGGLCPALPHKGKFSWYQLIEYVKGQCFSQLINNFVSCFSQI